MNSAVAGRERIRCGCADCRSRGDYATSRPKNLLELPCCWSDLAVGAAPDPGLKTALGGIKPGQVLEHIKVLASDEFEGRGPGTPGEEKTVAYLTGQFQKMGLKPGNPDGTFVQDVPLVGFQAKQVQGSFQLGRRPIALSFPNDFVAVSRRMAEEVKVGDSDVVFVGYGVVAPEYGWDDYKGLDVRGKTLIMLVNDPPVPDPKDPSKLDPSFFKGRAMTYYGRWTYKYEIASEKGAAAAILVHETGPAGYPFEVVRGSWSRENFDIAQPQAGQAPTGSPSRDGSPSTRPRSCSQAVRPGLRGAQAGRRAPRFPAGAARLQGAVRHHEHAPRGQVAERRRQARGVRSLTQERDAWSTRRTGTTWGAIRQLPGRPDLQRRRRQRLGRRRRARDRPRASPGQAAAQAIDPVPGRHRRGKRIARRQVLRGPPALSPGAHPGRHQPRRDQSLGADRRHHQHRHGPDRRSTTCSSRSPQRHGRTVAPDADPEKGYYLPLRPLRVRQARRARARPQGRAPVHRQIGRLRQDETGRVHGQGLPQAQRRGETRLGPLRRRRGPEAPGRARLSHRPGATLPRVEARQRVPEPRREAMLKAAKP